VIAGGEEGSVLAWLITCIDFVCFKDWFVLKKRFADIYNLVVFQYSIATSALVLDRFLKSAG